MRATTQVMLGVSLRARWDATLVIIMNAITEDIEMDPPWAMMFVYDLVMCDMTREEVEVDLETWRVAFDMHGLKISRTKTEYLPSPANEPEKKIVDAELPTAQAHSDILQVHWVIVQERGRFT